MASAAQVPKCWELNNCKWPNDPCIFRSPMLGRKLDGSLTLSFSRSRWGPEGCGYIPMWLLWVPQEGGGYVAIWISLQYGKVHR